MTFPEMTKAGEPELTEGNVALACDRWAEAAGWTVERFEQGRRSMICEGLPDRRYVHLARGLRVWVELKKPESTRFGKKGQRIQGEMGKLTKAQHVWLLSELAADSLATVIDDRAQLEKLFAILAGPRVGRMPDALDYCRELVRLCVLRGYRREAA